MSKPNPLGIVAAAELAQASKNKKANKQSAAEQNQPLQALYWFIAIVCITSIVVDLVGLVVQ